MNIRLQQTKNSILIALLSVVLLFSLGPVSSARSATPLPYLRQTEAVHRNRTIQAVDFLKLSTTNSDNHSFTWYSFNALIASHSHQASLQLKISYRPIAADLLNAHHTHHKIAPGTEADVRFIA